MAGSSFDTESLRIVCEKKVVEVLKENPELSTLKIIYCNEYPDMNTLISHIDLKIVPMSPQRVGLGESAIFRYRPYLMVNMVSKNKEFEINKKIALFISKLTKKVINKEIDGICFIGVVDRILPIDKDWTKKTSSIQMMYDEFING